MSTERAPSIGPTEELSFDPIGRRVRQIVQEPIQDLGALANILDQAQEFADEKGATRTIVRGLIPDDQTHVPRDFSVEAAIPLAGTFANHHLTYFGANDPERNSTVVAEEMNLLREVLGQPVKTPAEVLKEVEHRGFQLELLEGEVSPADLARLRTMYESSFQSYPFPIENEIARMIRDPDTRVCVARYLEDGQLYSVAATEQVTLNTGQGSFIMTEMGDSARMPDELAKGLNAALKLVLIAEARRTGVDVLFCESRAALGAVNSINRSIGMQWRGLLPKHTAISGPADVDEVARDGAINGQYGNMHVWACNSDQIEHIGRQVEAYYAAP